MRNHFCHGKTISITYFECVWIQHAMRMRRVVLSSMACPAVQYFSTLSHKRQDFRRKKKFTEHIMYVLISSRILSETFLILRRTELDMIKKYMLFFM